MSALVFVSLIGFEWAASYAIDVMNVVHTVPVETSKLVPMLRTGWLYLDIVLTSAVLLAGVGAFIKDMFVGE
jgi:hypothetical protein